ncbi:MAG: NADP-dependent oxidoreductase [Actinomycetia bacterium]|nr:NADP-dependent oxidoreductase [Actinomycetes bacterium]MCP4223972.1 NADP-dependent oxidoreductase [Actinomycetes bacterium]MCP5031256.1 NADP-dependent oxidoreductase [Actinomycetes bacterium]
MANTQVLIDSLPEGRLEPSNFRLETAPVPDPGDGEVLCRTVAVTIGAGQRAGLQGSASYAGAPEAGRVMGGAGIATVEASNHAGFRTGDLVRAQTGWQEYSVHRGEHLDAVDSDVDTGHLLGPLGTNGLTAYFGLVNVGEVAEGDTVVVSAAAGSVGHLVGQMAKALGASVVGVAGSDEKCALLVDELGFDAAVNRKDGDFRDAFKAATPDRINVYFDNTGGPILETALFRMATHGRIVCCGAVSQYDTSSPSGGPRGIPGLLVNNRVRMEGFLVFDFEDQYAEARSRMGGWVNDGRLKPRVTTYEGLEAAPQAFVDLLSGTTVGTTVVNVS